MENTIATGNVYEMWAEGSDKSLGHKKDGNMGAIPHDVGNKIMVIFIRGGGPWDLL